MVMVLPTIGPTFTPKGSPEVLALTALPSMSNVIFVIELLSQTVWSRVGLAEVTVIFAFGMMVILPTSVTGAQVPEVVTV